MAGTEQAPLESQHGLDDKEFFLLRLATQPTLKFESPQTPLSSQSRRMAKHTRTRLWPTIGLSRLPALPPPLRPKATLGWISLVTAVQLIPDKEKNGSQSPILIAKN